MFKITKESIKELLLNETVFSKEGAEFLSGYLIDKETKISIDYFMCIALDSKNEKGLFIIPEVIEDVFEEVKKKDIVSFINRITGFNVDAVIYESDNIIIYQH